MTANQQAVVLVEKAKSSASLGPESRRLELRLLIHPDRFGRDAAWVKRAEAATYKLESLYAIKKQRPVTIGKWTIIAPLAKGDIADLHRAESAGTQGVLKIAQAARDNDLIDNERKTLKAIHKSSSPFGRYLPSTLDGFTASGRAVNVLTLADGFIPLADLKSIVSLDFRHVVWMMNRALSALGFVHRLGVVHGSVTPDHLLYCPGDHNLCLVDWCYASTGDPIKAIVKAHW